MRINHNIAALNTHRQLGQANNAQQNSMEKLSSGLRINNASDDAAGLAISEKMRGQIRGLDMAAKNAQDGISMIQTAEGGLNETHSILQRMRELSVQASNETMEAEDRTAIGEELKALATEIDRISSDTEFNGKSLLNGDLSTSLDQASSTLKKGATLTNATTTTVAEINVDGAEGGTTYTFSEGAAADELVLSGGGKTQAITVDAMTANGEQELNFAELGVSVTLVGTGADAATDIVKDIGTGGLTVGTSASSSSATFAIGANEGQTMSVSFNDMSTSSLGQSSNLDALVKSKAASAIVATSADSQNLITEIDGAIEGVSKQRSEFGAAQNRLDHTINNLSTSSENLTAAESRIRDVDMAKEMMDQTKNSILAQASQAMLAQANQLPQGVLQLLR